MISRMALLALLLAGIFDPENVAQIRVSLGILKVKVFSPTRLREPHLAPCTAYHVPRTLLAAPLTLNPYTAPWFLHWDGDSLFYTTATYPVLTQLMAAKLFSILPKLFIAVIIRGWPMIHYRLR